MPCTGSMASTLHLTGSQDDGPIRKTTRKNRQRVELAVSASVQTLCPNFLQAAYLGSGWRLDKWGNKLSRRQPLPGS